MLDRVEMNIVHASFEILIVAYRVLPETSLPKRILATVIPDNGRARCDNTPGERSLDRLPTAGKIGVTGRQSQNGVQMIRQNYDRIDRKRFAIPRMAKRGAQQSNMIDEQG